MSGSLFKRSIYSIRLMLSFSAALILFSGCGEKKTGREQAHIYASIDEAIEHVPDYDKERETRIQNLKKRISQEPSEEIQRELTDWLISEYEAYNSDSALYYINRNLENNTVKNNDRLTKLLLIKKADVAAHAGLFGESTRILDQIHVENLDSTLLEQYYSAYCDLYQYQSEYANNSEYAERYAKLREIYIDSIGRVAPSSSINYIVNLAAETAREGNYLDAERMIRENMDKYSSGDRNFSILASILADLYKQQNDRENYQKYIGLSALSDLQGAIKENMAIRALATICYEDGDLERADHYLRQSFADANFYSARMRNAQSSRMLPVIGEAYTNQQKKLNHQLRLFVIFISILALGFIIISVFAILQVKKIRMSNRKTKEMLDEVSVLTQKLRGVNSELKKTNEELQTTNRISNEYGVLFMEYCSLSLSRLQQYQQSLKVAALQGNMAALMKKIESPTLESSMTAEFYNKFDEAILNIYPGFVEKFNELLKPEERIVLKPREVLNTELRVFALMKMGISDPEKIAKFLRCSVTTVYTYRSKMKKKALDPDQFESQLLIK